MTLKSATAVAHSTTLREIWKLDWHSLRPLSATAPLASGFRLDEGVFSEVWFPAAEFFLEEEGDGEDFVVFPWATDNLNSLWQTGRGAAHTNDGRGPAEQVEKGGVRVIKEA